MPDALENGMLYISMEYATTIHLCPCGCGNQVITPLSPTDWNLSYDGETVTLYPSIGNWNFPCRSHYWIRKSKIVRAPGWSDSKVNEGRKKDKKKKRAFFTKEKK
ncbi:MAG: DUF6527 family protein [Puia sp.]|nr:DUF6527 family protein [Puia sp.]